jgi:chemotaxis methyl-accepting protein methylase
LGSRQFWLSVAREGTPINDGARLDLSYIRFEGKKPTRPKFDFARATGGPLPSAAAPAAESRLDDFAAWVLSRAGLDATAYRAPPLERRLPACLRALKVPSTEAARAVLERKPRLVPKLINFLLNGTTEFFREPGVFDAIRAQVLPVLAGRNPRLRIWSAACSNGAELYSMAILLSEAGLLEQSRLLGTDCRRDAIEQARSGLYDATMLRLVRSPIRDKYFEPCGQLWRPVRALRRHVQWKVADLLGGGELGPWDMILWRNTAIYLHARPVSTIWRRLVSALAPQGVVITGKVERPPADVALARLARCIYCVAGSGATGPAGGTPQALLPRPRKN